MTPQVLVSWTYSFSDQTGFLLQRRKALSGSWTLDIPTDSSTFEYTDNDVVIGNTCSYHVAATNPYGTGSFSNIGSVYITSTGPITLYLTTNASSDIKPYDGTISSSASPTVVPDITVYGDSHDFTQSFDEKLVGFRTLSITDGSITSGSGNTYIVLTTNTNTGSITGPPTGSIDTGSYLVIPPDTNLSYDTYNISIYNAASGSNGFLLFNNQDFVYTLTSSNCISWSVVSTSSTYPSQIVGYGNGRYIGLNAGGNFNNAQYSDDGGVTWNIITMPTSNLMFDVLYTGTKFVACGVNGTIVTSSNGADWWAGSVGTTDFLNSIAYDGVGRYVAASRTNQGSPGGTGTLYTSTNLINWTAVSSSVPTTNGYLGVTHSPLSGGMFLAVGEGGLMATSSNGINWMDNSGVIPIVNSGLPAVTWNNTGLYFYLANGGGYILTSTDGLNWTLDAINPYYNYGGSNYSGVQRISYYSSLKKLVIFGTAPTV